jgi:hypothetical protein
MPNMGEAEVMAKDVSDLAGATGKKTTFDAAAVPGLTTVTDAVPLVAMYAAGTAAANCEGDTNVVLSG